MALTGGAAILARLRNQRAASAAPSVVVAYASQTGTAQDISQSINAECNGQNIKSKVLSLNDLKFENVSASKTPVIICVVSSTGDGEPPDNSQTFFKDLKQARVSGSKQAFKGVKYTCLGLGDSNYTSFMFVPRLLKKGLDELGAERFYECREVDEVDGLDDPADEWIEKLWEPLTNVYKGISKQNQNGQTLERKDSKKDKNPVLFFANQSNKISDLHLPQDLDIQGVPAVPVLGIKVDLSESKSDQTPIVQESRYQAKIACARKLTADWSDREVYQMTFDLGHSEISFTPGDSLDIMPQNNLDFVNRLLDRLQLNGDLQLSVSSLPEVEKTLPHIKPHYTIRDCFLYGLEVCATPKKSLLRYLAQYCQSSDEATKLKLLVSKTGRKAYQKFVLGAKISFLDILEHFTSCHPPLDGLIELLPPLAPRMYSIANSAKVNSREVKIAFSVAKYETSIDPRIGVATSWLKDLCEKVIKKDQQLDQILAEDLNISDVSETRVGVAVRSGGVFCLPTDLSKPLILIGPGTGVAPFVGFLEERKHLLKNWSGEVGPCWLFFGCRRQDEDYLFKETLEELKEEDIITHFHVAFSRETEQKVYVQDLMNQHSGSLYHDLYENNGFVFVCGDGTQMAQDVHKCLIEIVVQQGKRSEEESVTWLNQKLQDHTYVRDIWS